ncbi:hypothetical protein BR93DRAFT_632255 [Coniochaeta sp. PMI_546]|nr:hypothetical protein BR93DRAFT_632255 [Coniochaeta sp. PMI_546]
MESKVYQHFLSYTQNLDKTQRVRGFSRQLQRTKHARRVFNTATNTMYGISVTLPTQIELIPIRDMSLPSAPQINNVSDVKHLQLSPNHYSRYRQRDGHTCEWSRQPCPIQPTLQHRCLVYIRTWQPVEAQLARNKEERDWPICSPHGLSHC